MKLINGMNKMMNKIAVLKEVNMTKKNKDGYVSKSEVQLIIQNYIRSIQMNDYGSDNGIPQLYRVMEKIEKMPIKDSF